MTHLANKTGLITGATNGIESRDEQEALFFWISTYRDCQAAPKELPGKLFLCDLSDGPNRQPQLSQKCEKYPIDVDRQ